MKAKLLTNRKGTALIVALLVMGVLMAISLALSVLVLRESIVTREFLDAGQSYYAAESASEIGLYGVKNSLPGWEPEGGVAQIRIDKDSKAVAELKVNNTCKAYPCFDDDYDTSGNSGFKPELKAFYATLGLNESATIPLFVVDSVTKKPTKITGFAVEFYAGFKKEDFKVKGSGGNQLNDWDVMRWKIVGFNNIDPSKPVTESISDFTAVTLSDNGIQTNAEMPSWFGTVKCNFPEDRYAGTQKIICADYTDIKNTTAREFYEYKGAGADVITHKEGYLLKDFILNHDLNYLTLTNLINPSVLGGNLNSARDDSKTKLFYRIELFTDKDGGGMTTTPAVREYANITADGYSGKSKQSVNVKIKRDSFMPVFNFSLYSTYMDESIGHGEKYWYGEPNL
jgi:hypothetical protein